MAEDSYSSAEADRDTGGEGSAYGQPVAQVVNSVPEDHHPRHGRHRIRHDSIVMGVTVTMTLRLAFTMGLCSWFAMIAAWTPIVVQKRFVVVVVIVADDCRFSEGNVVWVDCKKTKSSCFSSWFVQILSD